MKTIKIDDPRLDESQSFLFAFNQGDVITKKGDRAIRGQIVDAVYVGELPGAKTAAIYSRGKTLYEIKLRDQALHIIDENDVEHTAK